MKILSRPRPRELSHAVVEAIGHHRTGARRRADANRYAHAHADDREEKPPYCMV